MKCPKDGTALQRVEALGLELDKCHKCDGIWFDHGELQRLRDAGVADIEGERVDVVTEGEYVPAGTLVEVLELEGNHLVVRAVEDESKQAPTT